MKKKIYEFYTMGKLIELTGLSKEDIIKDIKSKKLKVIKVNNYYLINKNKLENYKKEKV